MTVHYADDTVTVHHGDCLDVLRGLPDASVDAIVTDPPYGLGFMGKEWDALPPGLPWAVECLRVLKPGGHLLAFGGTRTWHRLAVAVEDAGFELRDSLAWLYGSGFPKSLDVSKAIDKRRDDTADIRVVCRWLRRAIDEHPTLTVQGIAERFGFHSRMVDRWAARDTDSQPSLPTLAQWDALREALGFGDDMDAEVLRLNLRKGEPGEAWAGREVIGQRATGIGTGRGAVPIIPDGNRDLTAANTADAKAWEGWGTALKPAFEPVVMGRKPLVGTVAGNVLAHGTGALNIDGCRIGDGEGVVTFDRAPREGHAVYDRSLGTVTGARPSEKGRWPTNVILDGSQADALDTQSGTLTSGANPTRRGVDGDRTAYGAFAGQENAAPARGADSGGASRFFYVAKADASERVKVDGVAHPTVKPLDVMRWLVRLVTPPGGVVLEPFAGSGTTVEACILEGFRCVAIEREADYLPLIVQRVHRRRDPVAAVQAAGEDGGLFDLLG